ncbi:MAG: hypothetical protein ABS79_00440 [Planctomycetes bacterium SCN 63-9]|nr:MAG: hypothetical protein ABS79_00440 [Planctomycetes bacterium SCN 63-9]
MIKLAYRATSGVEAFGWIHGVEGMEEAIQRPYLKTATLKAARAEGLGFRNRHRRIRDAVIQVFIPITGAPAEAYRLADWGD